MPVYKFNSFAEASQALWKVEPDESLDSLSVLWDLAEFIHELRPREKCRRGIFKFKSLEEANDLH
ncbi:MAG: hypothetical protein ACE5HO_12675 [bacterium]